MKRLISLSLLIISGISIMMLSGCGKDDPSPQDVKLKKLMAHSWIISSVTVDDVNQTSLFTNMTLNFTKTNYTTTHGGLVWPSSGTWEFDNKQGTTIIRNDDLEITITELTSTSLKLSLTWNSTTYGPGRQGSIAGNHVFSFTEM